MTADDADGGEGLLGVHIPVAITCWGRISAMFDCSFVVGKIELRTLRY